MTFWAAAGVREGGPAPSNSKIKIKKKKTIKMLHYTRSLPKSLEVRDKIKGNWVENGEGFTTKFFNKRKGAFTK